MIQKYIKVTSFNHLAKDKELSTNWENLGNEIPTDNFDLITLWLKIQKEGSINIRFRVGLQIVSGGDMYFFQIGSSYYNKIKLTPEYYEIDNENSHINMIERVDLAGSTYAQVQVKHEGFLGTKGQIIDSHYNLTSAVF